MGIFTTLFPSAVMIDSSLTMSARLRLIASLTFWLCRAWSIGPLRCSDQSCFDNDTVCCIMGHPLPRQQRADVLQQFVRAHAAVALLANEPVVHIVDAAKLLHVRRLRRGRDLHHVLQVGEQLLLDGLAQPLVAGVLEG